MADIELPKTPTTLSPEALFRYQVISFVFAREALGELRAVAIAEAVETTHITETGEARTVRLRTLYRWVAAHRREGVSGLQPAIRQVEPTALSAEFVAFLQSEKTADPKASIPEIIRRARQQQVLSADEPVCRATAYRAAVRLELPVTQRSSKRDADIRRFAYPNRMRMVLVDGKHFRAGQARLKRVAFFFIDDCSRRILGVVIGTSESTELFMRGLFQVILQFGLMDILCFDRGPGFNSHDTHAVCVRLEIRFIHGRRRYPEGHGKIERFNETAWSDILRGLCRPEVDPDLGSLELRLRHYVEHQYNLREHEALAGLSPAARWDADERPLRFPSSQEDLRSRFLVTEVRRVSSDNIVSVDGVSYEMPRGHARARVELRRQTLHGSIWAPHKGQLVRLHPVDLAQNAEARRANPAAESPSEDLREPPLTAAAMAFNRDFGPLPGPTGAPARRSTKPSPRKT
ncbi:DDE-type integrase/transposase/recombinase [Myxococcota bacterium]